jgi:MFS family permease
MMHSVFQLLAALGVIAGLVWAFTAGTVAVLDDSEKRSIREQVTKIWIGIQEAGPFGIVKAPLLLFSTIVDTAYGQQIFSWRGFWRSCAINSVLVICSLLVTGAYVGRPLGIETFPWDAFDKTLQAVEETAKNSPAPQKPNAGRTSQSETMAQHGSLD